MTQYITYRWCMLVQSMCARIPPPLSKGCLNRYYGTEGYTCVPQAPQGRNNPLKL